MHSVLRHEILFTFSFVWPLSIVFSSLFHPPAAKLTPWTIMIWILSGPMGAGVLLWRAFGRPWESVGASTPTAGSSPSSPSPARPKPMKGLAWAFWTGSAILLVSGVAIFYHPGWTPIYYTLIEGHSWLGFGVWSLLIGYVLIHARQEGRSGDVYLVFLFMALVSLLVVSLNFMSPWYALNPPLLAITIHSARRLGRRLGEKGATPAFLTGMALLYVGALSFATGAYIAEPFNSLLNNNMGLYVLYIHGGLVLLMLPLIVGMTLKHVFPHLHQGARDTFRFVFRVSIPVMLALFAGSSLYAHWKWFGLDAGVHLWPPFKAQKLYAWIGLPTRHAQTYETHIDPPPMPEAYAFPAGYDHTLNDSRVCATSGCHPSLVGQWASSSHRYSAADVFFRKVVERMAQEKGTREYNYVCINCHDPVGMMHPDREYALSPERLSESYGITCKSCHTMTDITREKRFGDGGYRLRPEMSYAVEVGEPDYTDRWAWFIRRDLRLHFKNYSNPMLFQSGEMCAGCHRATLPGFLTGKKDMLVVDLYNSWLKSSYPSQGETCISCHMPPSERDERGIYFPDHRIPGLNVALSRLISADEETLSEVRRFERYSLDWIQGRAEGGPTGPFLSMDLELPRNIPPRSTFTMAVKTANRRVGHYYPSGPSTLNEIWLDLAVTDATGREIFRSGALEPDTQEIDPDARRLGKRIMDSEGKQIADCAVWRADHAEGGRRLEPFETTEDRFEIAVPAGATGPLTIAARWNYRRASQAFVEWILGEDAEPFPTVELSSVSADVPVSP